MPLTSKQLEWLRRGEYTPPEEEDYSAVSDVVTATEPFWGKDAPTLTLPSEQPPIPPGASAHVTAEEPWPSEFPELAPFTAEAPVVAPIVEPPAEVPIVPPSEEEVIAEWEAEYYEPKKVEIEKDWQGFLQVYKARYKGRILTSNIQYQEYQAAEEIYKTNLEELEKARTGAVEELRGQVKIQTDVITQGQAFYTLFDQEAIEGEVRFFAKNIDDVVAAIPEYRKALEAYRTMIDELPVAETDEDKQAREDTLASLNEQLEYLLMIETNPEYVMRPQEVFEKLPWWKRATEAFKASPWWAKVLPIMNVGIPLMAALPKPVRGFIETADDIWGSFFWQSFSAIPEFFTSGMKPTKHPWYIEWKGIVGGGEPFWGTEAREEYEEAVPGWGQTLISLMNPIYWVGIPVVGKLAITGIRAVTKLPAITRALPAAGRLAPAMRAGAPLRGIEATWGVEGAVERLPALAIYGRISQRIPAIAQRLPQIGRLMEPVAPKLAVAMEPAAAAARVSLWGGGMLKTAAVGYLKAYTLPFRVGARVLGPVGRPIRYEFGMRAATWGRVQRTAREKGLTVRYLRATLPESPLAQYAVEGPGVKVFARDISEVRSYLTTGSLVPSDIVGQMERVYIKELGEMVSKAEFRSPNIVGGVIRETPRGTVYSLGDYETLQVISESQLLQRLKPRGVSEVLWKEAQEAYTRFGEVMGRAQEWMQRMEIPSNEELLSQIFVSERSRQLALAVSKVPGARSVIGAVNATVLMETQAERATIMWASILWRGQAYKGFLMSRMMQWGHSGTLLGVKTVREVRAGVEMEWPKVTKVQLRAGQENASLALGDVLQSRPGPASPYLFTDAQASYINSLHDVYDLVRGFLRNEQAKLAQRGWIEPSWVREIDLPEALHYVSRRVTKRRVGLPQVELVPTQRRIGASPSFLMNRIYETMMEGAQRGVVYGKSAEEYVAAYIDGAIKLVADKRLAYQVRPLGQTVAEAVERLRPGIKSNLIYTSNQLRRLGGGNVVEYLADGTKVIRRVPGLRQEVTNIIRGKVPAEPSLAAVDRHFPSIGLKLRRSLDITPPNFKRAIRGISEEIWQKANISRDRFEQAVNAVRMEARARQPLVQRPRAEVAKERIIEEYVAGHESLPRSEFLTKYTREQLAEMDVYTTMGGKAGYCLKPPNAAGEIEFVGLFNNTGVKGVGGELVLDALARCKGKTVFGDCFGKFLKQYYQKFGFKATGSARFKVSMAPENWNYAKWGKPNIIFIRYQEVPSVSVIRGNLERIGYKALSSAERRRVRATLKFAERSPGGKVWPPRLAEEPKPLPRPVGIREEAVTSGEITTALNRLNVETHQSANLLAKIYQNSYDLASAERRVALKSLYADIDDEIVRTRTLLDRLKVEYKGLAGVVEHAPQKAKLLDHPALRGRLFDIEVVNAIRKATEVDTNNWLKAASTASSIMRTAIAALDFSAPFIHGLPVLGNDMANAALGRPTFIWARATGRHYAAFFRETIHARYLVHNEAAAAQFTQQYGGFLGGSEWYEAMGEIQRLFRGTARVAGGEGDIPVWLLKQTYGRAERAFGAFGDVARLELWKALKPVTRQDELYTLANTINKMTGVIDSTGLGISASQRSLEGAFVFFAPRYTRAGLALMGDIFRGGLRGDMARKSFAGFLGGGMAMYIGMSYALGQKPNLDPTSSRFMSLVIGNQWVGMGGFYTWGIRFVADVAEAASRDPSGFISTSRRDNPFLKAAYSKSSALTGFIVSLITKRNFLGEPIESGADYARFMATQITPIALQSTFLEQERGNLPGFIAEILGMRSFPKSISDHKRALQDSLAIFAPHITAEQRKIMEKRPLVWGDLNQLQKQELLDENEELRLMTDEYNAQRIRRGDEFAATMGEWRTRYDEINTWRSDKWNVTIAEYDKNMVLKRRWRENDPSLTTEEISAAKSAGKTLRDKLKDIDIGASARREQLEADFPTVYEAFNEWAAEDDPLEYVGDVAYREYMDLMYGQEGLYDQYDNYLYDEAEKRKQEFVDRWGLVVYDYVQDRMAFARDEPPLLQELRKARRILRPYWEVRERLQAEGEYPIDSETQEQWVLERLRAENPQAAHTYETMVSLYTTNPLRFDEFRRLSYISAIFRYVDSIRQPTLDAAVRAEREKWRGNNPDAEAYLWMFYDIIPLAERKI